MRTLRTQTVVVVVVVVVVACSDISNRFLSAFSLGSTLCGLFGPVATSSMDHFSDPRAGSPAAMASSSQRPPWMPLCEHAPWVGASFAQMPQMPPMQYQMQVVTSAAAAAERAAALAEAAHSAVRGLVEDAQQVLEESRTVRIETIMASELAESCAANAKLYEELTQDHAKAAAKNAGSVAKTAGNVAAAKKAAMHADKAAVSAIDNAGKAAFSAAQATDSAKAGKHSAFDAELSSVKAGNAASKAEVMQEYALNHAQAAEGHFAVWKACCPPVPKRRRITSKGPDKSHGC